MGSQTYEITFADRARAVLWAELGDCDATIVLGKATLRAELPDPAAFAGLMKRIAALRLKAVHVQLVAPPPGQ